MILLQAKSIARFFGGEALFENIHLEIQDKSRIALVGRNGAGKSTLLKIIAGVETPDEGSIAKKKEVKIGYLAQNSGLDSSQTVWDEMLSAFEQLRLKETQLRQIEQEIAEYQDETSIKYQELLSTYANIQHEFELAGGYQYEAEIRTILHGFQFDESFFQRKINTLSGGQRTRLSLVKLLLEKPDLLILDEPTNHLDIETLNWLETYLQGYRGALLIVSHDRYFLDKIVTEVYDLTYHQLYHYKGNYSKFLDEKAERLTLQWKEYEKQQIEINKLEDFVQKNLARASTTKRAQSRRKKLEKMERMDKPQGDERSAQFLFQIERNSGNVVMQLADGAIGYDQQTLSAPVSIDLRRQESIAIVGPNGVGKSTLLKSIIGEIPFIFGKVELGTNVDLGYYDQEQAELHSTKDVLHELWDEHPLTPEKEIRTVLGGFLFSGDDVNKAVSMLSGGEKARLALAKLSMNRENFLILDEPTNHLDIDSKEVLENALIDYAGTLLFVSHDRYFINRVATKVIELTPQGSVLYHGNYDYFIEKKQEAIELAELKAQEQPEKTELPTNISDTKRAYKENKEVQKQLRSQQRKVTTLEKELATIEIQIEAIQTEMMLPENLESHLILQELNAKLELVEAEQEKLMEEWEQTSLELEQLENQ